MRIQSFLIPDNDRGCPEMFYRGGNKSGCFIKLPKGGTLTLDTYFNSFSYTKYRDYTSVGSVSFSCRFKGSARIALCVYDGAEHIVLETDADGEAVLSADFSSLPKMGFLYPKITALTDCIIEGGEYSSECVSAEISCCIAVCTFKREKYVLKNIEQLRNFKFSFIDRAFIIDNGKTLDYDALSDEFVKVLPNKNYGGSGGFTRGMIEACDGGYSHIILMDDDVEFYPEVLERMTVFVSLLREEFSKSRISAAMLFLSEKTPYIQWEMGGLWTGHGIESSKRNVDIRLSATILDNLDNFNIDYGAWWCLCLPVSSIKTNGLSMPFFIKLDDVEYGLRLLNDPHVITMNGIAVFHESFEKKINMSLDYYTIRNELVTVSLHGGGISDAMVLFIYSIGKQMLLYRYDNILLILKAVRDFLGGVDFFAGTDEDILNQDIMQSSPKMMPMSEIPGWNESMRQDDHIGKNKITVPMILTLGGHLIPAFALKKGIVAYPLSRISAEDTFLHRSVIQYQLGGSGGILTRRNCAKFFKYGFLSLGVLFKLLFNYKKVQRDYLFGKSEITSFEFWRRHLNIPNDHTDLG